MMCAGVERRTSSCSTDEQQQQQRRLSPQLRPRLAAIATGLLHRAGKNAQLRPPSDQPASATHVRHSVTASIATTKVIWQMAELLCEVHPTPRLYSPGGSIGLTVWLQFTVACFCWRVRPPNLPFPRGGGQGPPSNTMCHWTLNVYLSMTSKPFERFKQEARM